MQGALDGDCDSSQNGRGGMFFVLEESFTVECTSFSELLRFPLVTASGYRIRETKWFRVGATPILDLVCL